MSAVQLANLRSTFPAPAHTTMALLCLPGAAEYLRECQGVTSEEIADDNEEEAEACDARLAYDNEQDNMCPDSPNQLRKPPTANKRTKYNIEKLNKELKTASEGVVVLSTKQEYERYACSSYMPFHLTMAEPRLEQLVDTVLCLLCGGWRCHKRRED